MRSAGFGWAINMLSLEDEAIAVAFRKHTLLPLDDCLYALQATIPHLTRSSLHRCYQRRGISRLPEVEGDKPARKAFRTYPSAGARAFYAAGTWGMALAKLINPGAA